MIERDDDEAIERSRLAAWPAHPARPGFADDVLARLPPAAARRPARLPLLVAGLAAGLAMGLALRAWWPVRDEAALGQVALAGASAASGELRATTRAQARLPGATVVAEAGAQLAWRADPAGVTIEQRAGEVFYRVDPRAGAAPLGVRTAHGEVIVTGTCFTVATTAARTEVLVHEGGVAVGARGQRVPVAAGQRVRLTRGGVGAVRERDTADELAGREPAPPLRALASSAPAAPAAPPLARDVDLVEPPPALLARWAEACRVSFDVAPMGYDDAWLDELLAMLALRDDEHAAVRAAIREVEARDTRRVTALYAALTGDDAPALPVNEMFGEIMASAELGEPAALRRAMARERAGLATPPGDAEAARASPYEEEVRALARSGDELEQAIAARLGAARARELRRLHGGWPGLRWDVAGCPRP